MVSVTILATHILHLLQPLEGQTIAKSDAARLAFYHFLKNLCEPGELLSTSVLERFFRTALTHAHWVENKGELFNEVSACLQHFSNETNQPIPLPPFATPDEIQVVNAESFATLEKVVEDWIHSRQGPTEQVRILRDREDKLLVCKIDLNRQLTVNVFDRSLCIRQGRLEPLNDDLVLHYTSELQIDSNKLSQIEISPHTIARFRFLNGQGQGQGFRGIQVRGYTFQKTGVFEGSELHRLPTLFYPLKRIEQFFIHRTTDPMYVELTSLLEQATELMAQRHPERLRFAEAAIERGKLAFEQVFIDDRFLKLLLDNLERALLLEIRENEAREMRTNGVIPSVLPIELPQQMSHSSRVINDPKLGLNLPAGQEFLEPEGPDLVEMQEAESCETIAPKNAQPSLEKLL
jgi:hypothetical protein